MRRRSLFDLRFLELDVLARDRVVLAEAHFLRLVARVLLGNIEEAGIGAADELDLDGCRLGHRGKSCKAEIHKAAKCAARSARSMTKSTDFVNQRTFRALKRR